MEICLVEACQADTMEICRVEVCQVEACQAGTMICRQPRLSHLPSRRNAARMRGPQAGAPASRAAMRANAAMEAGSVAALMSMMCSIEKCRLDSGRTGTACPRDTMHT